MPASAWSSREDDMLIAMRCDGAGYKIIAGALGRSREGVKPRVDILTRRGALDAMSGEVLAGTIANASARFVADGLRIYGSLAA